MSLLGSDLDFYFTYMLLSTWEQYVRFLVCLKPCYETNSMSVAYYLKREFRIYKQCRNDNTTTKIILYFFIEFAFWGTEYLSHYGETTQFVRLLVMFNE